MKYKTKGFKRTFILILAAALLVAAGALLYRQQITLWLEQEARNSLVEDGKEITQTISHLFGVQLQVLTAVAVSLEDQNIDNKAVLTRYLQEQNKRNSFQLTGFQFSDGEALFSNGRNIKNFLSAQDIEDAYEHSHFISTPRINPFNPDEKMIILAVPVRKNHQAKGVVFAGQLLNTYEEALSNSSLGSNGVSFIINRYGDVLVSYPKAALDNIFEVAEQSVFDKGMSAAEIRHNMHENKSGVSGYIFNGQHRFSSYFPIGYNQWYVLSVLPTDSVTDKAKQLVVMSLVLCLSVLVVLALLLAFILYLQHQSAKALFKLGFVDALTGADNASAFQLKYPAAIENFRKKQKPFAMVLININSFKAINNIYGFEQGDLVLKQVATVLQKGLAEGELFCRSGADVFLLLVECPSRDELGRRIDALAMRARQVCQLGKEYAPISLTCGIYVVDEDVPFYMMLDRANLAWASAKERAGGGLYAFYDSQYLNRIITEKRIESSMEQALTNREFKVYLQPKYDLKTDHIVSAEALVRWQHPERGLISPDWFIPVFEKNGFVLKLDHFILQEVISLLKGWQAANQPVVPIGVNFSRLHLEEPDFVENLVQETEKHNISRELIEIELTESMAANDEVIMTRVLDELHIAGFSVAMDDFGAGYSSLNLLKNLDFDCVKLDKEFLARGEGNPRMRQVILGLVKMVKELGSKIVAEGVETKEQAEFLRSIGCDMAQGYLYSRPLPAAEFEKRLREDAAR